MFIFPFKNYNFQKYSKKLGLREASYKNWNNPALPFTPFDATNKILLCEKWIKSLENYQVLYILARENIITRIKACLKMGRIWEIMIRP